MDRIDLTGALAFGTLGLVLIVAALMLMRFLRKPASRHPMAGQHERNIEEIRADAGVTEPVRRNGPVA